MNAKYYGVKMYGVDMDDLLFKPTKELLALPRVKKYLKERDFSDEQFDLDVFLADDIFEQNDVLLQKVAGKAIPITLCSVDKVHGYKTYVGLNAGFPWQFKPAIAMENVSVATWTILNPYLNMSPEDFAKQFKEINDVGCI